MKKVILCAFVAIAMLASCDNYVSNLGYTSHEREVLGDFIEYCRANDGLQQPPLIRDKFFTCSDAVLRDLALYYGNQDEFADVSDYEHQREVDAIIYGK